MRLIRTLAIAALFITATPFRPAMAGVTVGAEKRTFDPGSFPAGHEQARPSVAWNGNGYLVVWEEWNGTDLDVLGARMDGAGSLLDAVPISIAAGPADQFAPAVAWDGTNYLVAWSDTILNVRTYATRVTAGGTVLDAPIALSDGPSDFLQGLAWSGTTYLAVWRGDLDALEGARITSGGQVLGTVRVDSSAHNKLGAASVASNGSLFLVAWAQDEYLDPDPRFVDMGIRAARVSADGAVLDVPDLLVGGQTFDQVDPQVASDGTNFLIAYANCRFCDQTAWDISGGLLTPAGDISSFDIARWGGFRNHFLPEVAWTGAYYIVTYFDCGAACPADGVSAIFASRVSADGTRVDARGMDLTASGNVSVRTAAAGSDPGRVAIAYQRSAPAPSGERVFMRLVDAVDTRIDSGPPEFDSSTTAQFRFSATQPVSRFECSLDGGPFNSCASSWTYTSLAAGPHWLLVRAVDAEGFTDPTLAEWSWTVDTSPPTITIRRPEPGGIYVDDVQVAKAGSTPVVVRSMTVEVRAADPGSGICGFTATVDGVPRPYEQDGSTYRFTYAPSGVGGDVLAAQAVNCARSPSSATIGVLGVGV